MTGSTWELITNPADERHGTLNAYVNHHCRCQACTEANSAAQVEARLRRASKVIPAHVHGSANGYINYKCRCPDCTAGYAESVRERRARKKTSK